MSATGTTLIYNNVILRDCETHTFDQSIEYDESGTDALFSKFRIRVESTLVAFTSLFQSSHASQVAVNGGDIGGSLGQQVRTINTLLSQPRKDFYYLINNAPARPAASINPKELSPDVLLVAAGYQDDGQVFYLDPFSPNNANAIPAEQVSDPSNGPNPMSVSVEQIYGGRTIRVSFEIEVCRRLCIEQNDPIPGGFSASELLGSGNTILSNRWSISETRDADWKLTRSIEGTLRVASKKYLPHLMRYFVVPTQPRGFSRVAQNFATDPTDLVLKYQIQDQQQDESPPPPAIKWSGHYAESGAGNNVAQVYSELNVTLQGPPGVNKQDLISAAGHVLKSRIPELRVTLNDASSSKSRPVIKEASIIEQIGEPIISLRVRVLQTAEGKKLTTRVKRMGAPMNIAGYHPDVWPTPSPYEANSIAGQFSCYLQNPCSIWHSVPQPAFGKQRPLVPGALKTDDPNDEDRDGDVDSDDEIEREARVKKEPEPVLYKSDEAFEEEETRISESQFQEEPYTFIEVESRYETDPGLVHLPYAGVDTPETAEENEEKPATSEMIELHGGLCQRTLIMTASRRDKSPVMPKPSKTRNHPGGIIEKLESHNVKFASPEIMADGLTRLYRAKQVIVYALNRPPRTNESLIIAASPIDGTTGETRTISGDDLYTDNAIDWNEP